MFEKLKDKSKFISIPKVETPAFRRADLSHYLEIYLTKVLVFKEPANLWLRPAMPARVNVTSPMLEKLLARYTPFDTTNKLLMHRDRAEDWFQRKKFLRISTRKNFFL